MSRWIRVQTSVFEHELFAHAEFSRRDAWLWLIANAAWKDTKHRVGSEVLPVPVGSMFITIRALQAAWHWKSDKRVRTFLSTLENELMIETKTDAGKTQITICNYSHYQEAGRSEDASGTQAGRSADAQKTPVHQDTSSSLRSSPTNRGTRLAADWVLPASWGKWALAQGHSENSVRLEAEKFRDFWIGKSGKDGTKLDWEATWRNWIRNASVPRPSSQAPPRESEHARHQRECREAIQSKLNGDHGNDQYGSSGPAFDLEPGDYRAH